MKPFFVSNPCRKCLYLTSAASLFVSWKTIPKLSLYSCHCNLYTSPMLDLNGGITNECNRQPVNVSSCKCFHHSQLNGVKRHIECNTFRLVPFLSCTDWLILKYACTIHNSVCVHLCFMTRKVLYFPIKFPINGYILHAAGIGDSYKIWECAPKWIQPMYTLTSASRNGKPSG